LRPGEKLTEELVFEKEELIPTRHKQIFVTKPMPLNYLEFLRRLSKLQQYCRNGAQSEIVRGEILALAEFSYSQNKVVA
jgi:FlaA1/EpsC-like NDP-sugar epimerase